MSHYYKTLAMLVTVGCLVTLSGCIIDPNQNTAGSNYQPNPGGKAYGAASGSSEWDRGCNDAKGGGYDRSGNAGQAYEDGWNACRTNGNQSGAQQQGGVEVAKQACTFQFGQSGYVQTVTPLKPGFGNYRDRQFRPEGCLHRRRPGQSLGLGLDVIYRRPRATQRAICHNLQARRAQ